MLDLGHPPPVLCSDAQVVELFHRLDGLPNTDRAQQRPREAAAPPRHPNHQEPNEGGLT